MQYFNLLNLYLQINKDYNQIVTVPWYNMAPRRPKILTEWANSLVGLHMRIPDNWWVGYNGTNLNDGMIVPFYIDSQKWYLELIFY
jgi:hypothetical protein